MRANGVYIAPEPFRWYQVPWSLGQPLAIAPLGRVVPVAADGLHPVAMAPEGLVVG